MICKGDKEKPRSLKDFGVRNMAEEGGILKRARDKGLRRGFRKRTTKRTTGEKKCFYRVFLLVALRESLATRLRNSRSAAIGYAVIPG